MLLLGDPAGFLGSEIGEKLKALAPLTQALEVEYKLAYATMTVYEKEDAKRS